MKMKRMPWRWLPALLLAAVLPACSKGQSPQTAAQLPTDLSGRQVVEDLIRQLRSTNRNPNPKGEPFVDYPRDYDWTAQETVENARQKLAALGKNAFPVLIDHVNDSEYSLSFPTAILHAFSVGEVCRMILENQVDSVGINYKCRLGSDGDQHSYTEYFGAGGWYDQDGLRAWWREHKQMTLREMQIEALQWRIERECAIGFPRQGDMDEYLQPLLDKLDALTRSPAGNADSQGERTSASSSIAAPPACEEPSSAGKPDR